MNITVYCGSGMGSKPEYADAAAELLDESHRIHAREGGMRGVDESALPVTMEVDYVRVYQLPDSK